MSGGIMQLVAHGAQNVYLTGNPEITFFKVVYRRHTNFAMETIEQTLNGSPNFSRKASGTVVRNGDLVDKMYLKLIISSVGSSNKTDGGKFAWCRRLGHNIIKNVDLEIGGSCIDKHYSSWMDIWYELSHTTAQERGYEKMIADVPEMTELREADVDGNFTKDYTMYVPLQFWFCRNTGLALPLIALQYHEVRVNVEFQDANKLICYTGAAPTGLSIKDASLMINYVFLDSIERRRFAQVGHEYLIEQLQFTGTESLQASTGSTTSGKFRLGFNHPCKELVWAVKGGNYTSGKSFLAYTHSDDWSTVVDDAAVNVASGMFSIDLNATTVGFPCASTYGTYPTSTSTSVSNSVEVSVLSSPGITFSGGSYKAGTGPDYYLNLTTNILGDGSYFLCDKIHDVVVTLVSDINNVITIDSVAVNSHTLTVRDLSIPIASWTQDNRVPSSTSSDVVVYQQGNYGLLIDGTGNPISDALIQLNGHDRFNIQKGAYFNYVQPAECHTRTPADGVNVYSFAIHPEQHQPSGSANLSRIDNTQLNLTFGDSTFASFLPSLKFFNNETLLYVFAFSYNVLRIMSGMGGVAYTN
jgi:hypothetical protein